MSKPKTDALLDDLMAAARHRGAESPAEMPFGFAQRVVRQAFSARPDPASPWHPYVSMVRYGLALAILVLCVSILINLPALQRAPSAEMAVQHHLSTLVLRR